MVVSNQKQIDKIKKSSKAGPRDRLELATAHAKPEQTVTMDKGRINTQSPQEVAVQKQLENISTQNAVNAELLKQNKPAQTTTEGLTKEQTLNPEIPQEMTTDTMVKDLLNKERNPKTLKEGVAGFGQDVGDVLAIEAKTFGDLYFGMRNFLKTGKSIDADKASEEYGKLTSSIKDDISSLSQGIGDADTIRKNIQQAVIANEALASSTKKAYNKNLAYYKDNGKSIEVEVILNRQELTGLYDKLLVAEQQGTLKNLRAGL
jgi:hypothetical protein